ncbi:MAG: C25 family cysteine peptidase, partial [Candidatus Sumerlaeota bacterium]|nr:C25 family cysteine peptidase [Candidatus Sumerlaeota bacterium]
MTPTVFAAVAAPSETVRMEMAWDAKDTEAKFRPFVAGRGARPRATVVDFSLRPSSPQDAPPIAMADLTESDRAKALAQIQGMVSTRDDGWFRFWPLRTVVVKPAPIAQSAGTSGLARVVLDVDGLAYGTPDAAASERARLNAEWGFAPVLKKFVDNPEALPLCLDPAPPAYTSPTRTLWTPARLPSGKAQFRFQVSRNDALRILPDHLEQAGLEPRTVDPRSIRLYSRGKEIPLLRFDNGDASFEPGESLVFYGEGSDSPYTTERAYWVVVGAESPGAPMPVNGPPPGAADLPHRPWQLARVRIEEDNALENRMGDFLSIREFRWVWATLRADKETSVTFSLPDLAEPDADWPESVPLKFDFFHSRPDQLPANAVPVSEREVLIEINGHSLERQRFRDDQDDEKEFQIPAALLKKNGNVARLRLASSSPGASPDRLDAGSFFDAVTVCYPRRPEAEDGRLLLSFQKEDRATTATFDLAGLAPDKPLAILDVTDPDAPRSIEPLRRNAQGVRIVVDADGGRKVLAARVDRLSSAPLFLNYTPSGLRDFSHQADFLIISHPEFLDLVKPLADLQARQGRLVETVNVLDIYDEFSMGELTPAAIKDFLWHAVTHWKVPPTYVLLVGDSSSDYRNETRYNVKVFVPTYRIALDNAEEIRACEHWYTTVLGADLYPDLILGRLSVNSREDAKRVVARVLAADQDLPLGPWRNRMTLVADDEVEFSQAADAFRKQAPESFFVDRVYLSQLPLERNFYIDPKFVEEEKLKVSTEATQAILDAFNRGSTFLAFWGHGSPN